MKNKLKFITVLAFLSIGVANAQVGIGTTTPNAAAELDVTSSTKGFLAPRMTTIERTAISIPADGLQVYDTDLKALMIYNSTTTGWNQFGSAATLIHSNGSTSFEAMSYGGIVGLNLNRTNGTYAAQTAIESGNRVGYVGFGGTDGATALSGARIEAVVDGTVATNSIPVRMSFEVMAQGATTRTSAMVIKSAANIGMGTSTPDASAKLEIKSTTQGFLPPRMTFVQMSAISSPAEGLIVYCTNCLPSKGLKIFDNIDWTDMQGVTAPKAAFTFTNNYYYTPNFYIGKVMDVDNSVFVKVNVTTAGTIVFSSATVNGYTLNGAGLAVTTGIQYVQFIPSGTQTAYYELGDDFTLTGTGTTTETTSVTINHVKVGADFPAHFNGITGEVTSNNLLATYVEGETFNNNGTCVSKPISASTCVGSIITVGSNNYPIANINGQCWMTQNLNELPNGVTVNATQWLATTQPDLGYYGYYNTGTIDGSAGWGTAQIGTEGLLYQWSAAMVGSTTERAQGICPTGWHIPSDCEWKYLEHGQGMSISQQNILGNRAHTNDNQGTPGYKLRIAGIGANNESGFGGLIAGNRNANGTFSNLDLFGNWWSSSATSDTAAFGRYLRTVTKSVGRNFNDKSVGFSVRCLQD